MMCFFCQQIQPIAQTCIHCQKSMAKYYCGVCKFFDDDPDKIIWHCDECGLCRVKSPDMGEMAHCKECNACMVVGHTKYYPTSTSNSFSRHTDYSASNCPICSEQLFSSTRTVMAPRPCRHAIHNHCWTSYLEHGNYSCPICSKSYK